MADFSQWWWQAPDPGPGPNPDLGDPIDQSLRFRGSSSLSGHTGGAGTASVWIKRGELGAAQTVMPGIAFDADDKLNSSVALFRDPNAWMHVVVNANGTYVNSVSVASGSAVSAGTIGASCELHLAAFYFIDGEALEPTAFGRFNSKGVWVPVDYSGSYGSNGFKLTFEDPSDIGKDYSGNGLDFSDSGFELGNQSSPDYDLMQDTPTQNYATINPLYPGASTSKANLTTANATGKPTILGLAGNVGVDGASVAWDGTEAGWTSTGAINFGQQPSGFAEISTRRMPKPAILDGREHFQALTGPGGGSFVPGPDQIPGKWTGMLFTSPNLSGDTYDPSDLGADFHSSSPPVNAFDGSTATRAGSDAKHWLVFKPDTPITVNTSLRVYTRNYKKNAVYSINTGAAQPNPLGDGKIDWADLGFTGVLTELGIRDNPDNSTRTYIYAIEVDGKILVDTGILGLAQSTFPNGLWWVKDRANTNQNQLIDSVRGGNLAVLSPSTGAETAYVPPAGDSVAWCWKASDSTETNNAGTIESQVSANTEAGFSIISYTGNATSGATVGHGLTQAPEVILVKARDVTGNWSVYHEYSDASNPENYYLVLNTTAARASNADRWNNTKPDSNVITLGNNSTVNHSGGMIAYCWHSVPGYSAFGKYEGNANIDGTFVYTPFRPALVITKCISAVSHWPLRDTDRDIHNPVTMALRADTDIEESTTDTFKMDIYSNGFKLRNTEADGGNSNGDYVYMAFAENPFGGSNVPPATAR